MDQAYNHPLFRRILFATIIIFRRKLPATETALIKFRLTIIIVWLTIFATIISIIEL